MVVTGGGRGIGRAIALAAAEAGARVVIADYGGAVDRNRAGSSEAADAVVAEIVAAGGEAVAAAVDISTMDGGRAAVQAAVDAFGRLDAVACAAGITVTKYLWEISEQEWDDVINVHLKGHFVCAKAASEVMIPQRSGSLIFFSSGALNGMPNVTAYATAKAGILGFTWSTANALQRYGITTNCMVPSAATRMSDNIFGNAGKLSERFGDNMRSDRAPGTYRDPSNVAPLAVYLMSDAARDINGQVFRVQGYEVGRLGMLRYAPVMTNLGPWDVDTLAARLPAELGPDLQPPPMPWPEPPRADDPADDEMEIYIAEPDGDARGAVIVLQEAFGVNEHIRDVCDRFAAAGYVAAAPHLFHRSGDPELGYDDMMAVVPYIMQLQADDLEADIDATLERLAQMGFAPGQVAAVGFCMGGTISFAAGCVWPLGAAVTFYGGGIAEGRFGLPPLLDLAPSLQCPWLGCFGDLDVSIPTVEVEGLRERSPAPHPPPRSCGTRTRTTASTATPAARTTKRQPRTRGRATLAFLGEHLSPT